MLLRKFLVFFFIVLICFSAGSVAVSGVAEPIVVLYTGKDPVIPDLKKSCCKYYELEKFSNTGIKANTVIISGHGGPPVYAGHSAEKLAKIISGFQPELIVLNSCFGSSTPILEALAEKNSKAMVVAPPFPIIIPGYTFTDNFFNLKLSLEDRAKGVVTTPYYPQLRWRINKAELAEAKSKVFKMSGNELKENYRRRVPPLIRVPMPSSLDKDSEILVLLTQKEVENIRKKK